MGKDAILLSMDVSNMYTNIPQEEGTEMQDTIRSITITHPSQHASYREMLGLIPNENSFQVNGENHLQTHGIAMRTKMAVSFSHIFMAKIETTLLH